MTNVSVIFMEERRVLVLGPPFRVEDVSLQINPSFCVTYDNDTQQLIIAGLCPYSYYQIEYSSFFSNQRSSQ